MKDESARASSIHQTETCGLDCNSLGGTTVVRWQTAKAGQRRRALGPVTELTDYHWKEADPNNHQSHNTGSHSRLAGGQKRNSHARSAFHHLSRHSCLKTDHYSVQVSDILEILIGDFNKHLPVYCPRRYFPTSWARHFEERCHSLLNFGLHSS